MKRARRIILALTLAAILALIVCGLWYVETLGACLYERNLPQC